MKKSVKSTKTKCISQKGITLVSLVITIIILLILAGVGINMSINSNGLFAKAKEATEKWNASVKEEETKIQNILEQANEIKAGITREPESLPDGWESTKVADIVTEKVSIDGENKTRNAPIPTGFVASQIDGEDSIDGGLVIYQGTEEVKGEAGSTAHTTAMTNRNQYVWIPVDDINYMVMCQLNNANNDGTVCNVILEETQGVYSLRCKTHNNSGENTTMDKLCGRIYTTTSSYKSVTEGTVYTYSMAFDDSVRASQKWDTTSYHEPNIISGADNESYQSYLKNSGVDTAEALLAQLQSDFNKMAISVAKYGGFYVGRYEAGNNGENKKNQKVLVAGPTTAVNGVDIAGADINTCVDGGRWYKMYNTIRNNTDINRANISSHMIWRKSV